MGNNTIQVTQSSLPPFEDYIAEIKDLWESKWLTNMGAKHKTLEAKLQEYLAVPNVTLFTNGHLALECALAAFELQGEVITTPFTFASTPHAIARNGLKPVFADINPVDYTLDVDKLESLITDKTSAIVPVHVYGNVCNTESIDSLAKKYNLKVIYDAAHTFGVKVNGKGVGEFGDASMFSFHATKVYNTIEGGAVTFKDDGLTRIFNDIKNFGIHGPESVRYIGGNAKMNEFQAAMGICNLKYVDAEIAKRKLVVERYQQNLKGTNGIKIWEAQKNVLPNYAYFPVVFDNYKKDRDQVFNELKSDNIIARKYFYPLANSFACYRNEHNIDDTPVAKYIADRVLTLPLYADLPLSEVDRVCDIIIR